MTRFPELDSYLTRRHSRRGVLFNDTYAAFTLVAATVAALLWANFGNSYEHFWHTEAGFDLGFWHFEMSLHGWVDEFLMALFFFVIGLDVRRDLSIGELALPGRALMPVVAAVGGLIVPAIVFLAINGGTNGASAWGTVISTDTAFALGIAVVALLGIYLMQRAGVWRLAPYLAVGLIVWGAVFASGVHATLAGLGAGGA